MRDRYPADWCVDLGERHSLEEAVGNAIDQSAGLTRLTTSTASMNRLDFQILLPGDCLGQLELKAKRQNYRNWPAIGPGVPESDVFILDELALRKIVDAGRYSFLLVKDFPAKRWCLWSTWELILARKVRVTRRLATTTPTVKGKLLIDLGSAPAQCTTVEAILHDLRKLAAEIDRQWNDIRPWPWTERAAISSTPRKGA
jgi:hypothetical protein